jgi:hypothetical protein
MSGILVFAMLIYAVESAWGAARGLLLACFPRLLAEPGVPTGRQEPAGGADSAAAYRRCARAAGPGATRQQVNEEFDAARASYLARREAGAIRYVSHEEAGRRLGMPSR